MIDDKDLPEGLRDPQETLKRGREILKKMDTSRLEKIEHIKGIKIPEDRYKWPCMNCGKEWLLLFGGTHEQGLYNLFCDGECEDRYAWKEMFGNPEK